MNALLISTIEPRLQVMKAWIKKNFSRYSDIGQPIDSNSDSTSCKALELKTGVGKPCLRRFFFIPPCWNERASISWLHWHKQKVNNNTNEKKDFEWSEQLQLRVQNKPGRDEIRYQLQPNIASIRVRFTRHPLTSNFPTTSPIAITVILSWFNSFVKLTDKNFIRAFFFFLKRERDYKVYEGPINHIISFHLSQLTKQVEENNVSIVPIIPYCQLKK
jgi:hypothetical protein